SAAATPVVPACRGNDRQGADQGPPRVNASRHVANSSRRARRTSWISRDSMPIGKGFVCTHAGGSTFRGAARPIAARARPSPPRARPLPGVAIRAWWGRSRRSRDEPARVVDRPCEGGDPGGESTEGVYVPKLIACSRCFAHVAGGPG